MFKPGPIIAVGVIAVLLLASPFGLGMLAESNVREEIERMNANPYASLEVTDYQRGWFTSHVTVDVTPGGYLFDAMEAQDPIVAAMMRDVTAPFVAEINHGPVLTLNGFGLGSYAVKAGLDSSVEWVSTAESDLGIPYVVELRGRAGFFSGFDFEGEIPPFDVVDESESLTFSGLEFTGHADGSELSFESNAERLAMQTTLLSFTLDGFGISGESEIRPGTFSLGSGEFTLGRFAAVNPLLGADEIVVIDALEVSGNISLNEAGNVDYGVVYEAAGFEAQGTPAVSDMALGFTLSNLDSSAFEDLYGLFTQPDAMANPMMVQMQMIPILDRIVAGAPTLAFDPLRFSMDAGRFDATLTAAIDPAAMPTGQLMDLTDPNVAMSAISAEFSLAVSKELLREIVALSLVTQMGPQLTGLGESEIENMMAEQADQMIMTMAAQGMLRDEGDIWSMAVVLESGTATVNGMPVPLGAMGIF